MARLIVFFNGVNKPGPSPWFGMPGGTFTLAVKADKFPDSLDFEMLCADGSTVALTPHNIIGAYKRRFDLGPGRYRMNAVGGKPLGMSAILVRHL